MHRLHSNDSHQLLTLGKRRKAHHGQVLIRMGAKGTNALLIVSGFLKISAPSANGYETLLSIRVRGDIVGETAILNERSRAATATACGEAIVSVIPEQALREYLADRPTAAIELAGMMADRLRWSNQRRIEASAFPVHTRLARVLTEMSASYGIRRHPGIEIGVDLTQAELSTLIGVSEVTIQRALKMLRDNEVIETGYRRVTVTDTTRLARLANGHELADGSQYP